MARDRASNALYGACFLAAGSKFQKKQAICVYLALSVKLRKGFRLSLLESKNHNLFKVLLSSTSGICTLEKEVIFLF